MIFLAHEQHLFPAWAAKEDVFTKPELEEVASSLVVRAWHRRLGQFSNRETQQLRARTTARDTSLDHATATVTWEQHNPAPKEVGRALVNYSAAEIRKIKGLKSTDINEALGYADSSYVALRGNIAFYEDEKSRPVTPALVDGGDGLD
ncbi:hypothetical protein BU16DRAFT_554201 [Lophium mytilinum]|uniref:Uncharacterized protein n=1 Tax=Lophium mytilinum TaxID=390894 RepID=A0A6A6RBD9_9PEZI|nr:hypothetical protein BU16DRAFT_554201 [Lophium mytilinum]